MRRPTSDERLQRSGCPRHQDAALPSPQPAAQVAFQGPSPPGANDLSGFVLSCAPGFLGNDRGVPPGWLLGGGRRWCDRSACRAPHPALCGHPLRRPRHRCQQGAVGRPRVGGRGPRRLEAHAVRSRPRPPEGTRDTGGSVPSVRLSPPSQRCPRSSGFSRDDGK